ncbi:hypothetical protein [Thomasclavelia cocleata]|uniref:hypothetical protein n=1 Tax=Thomasclavelia cocleata TaxID=69824 RepID=UPI00242E7CFF|nr:hypothetical protein [Thomasclavelia cocleata]
MDKIIWIKYFLKSKFNIILNKFNLIKFVNHKYKSEIFDLYDTNQLIKKWILEGKPRMIARYGSNEAYVTAETIGVNLGIKKKIRKKLLLSIYRNAGLFPYGEKTAIEFGNLMVDVSKEVDLLGAWKTIMQDYLINEVCSKNVKLTHLSSLEPYYEENIPWTSALKGKKVLIIHPFNKTIEEQYKRRDKIFANKNILPEFDLYTLKAVQTIAGEKDERFKHWFEALDYMYNEALKIDFDVAIIGCGAYGFPLAAKLKRAGKITIHLGGAVQILFGIKGSRWDNGEVSKFYNEYWVRPDDKDKPQNANNVENGCYW